MKIKAITAYKDLYENKNIEVGMIYDTTPERARIIVGRNFATYVTEEKAEEKPKREVKRKK